MSIELNTLICRRVADMDDPHVQSYIDACARCKKAVWRAYSSPKNVDRVICGHCVDADVAEYEAAGENVVKVVKPTDEQMDDIRKWEWRTARRWHR